MVQQLLGFADVDVNCDDNFCSRWSPLPYDAPFFWIITIVLEVQVQLFTLGEGLEMGFQKVEMTMLTQRSFQSHITKHVGGVAVVFNQGDNHDSGHLI